MKVRSFPNIEKAVYRRKEYIGYGGGTWRIYKYEGEWRAVKQNSQSGFLSARTLAEISVKLEAKAKEAAHEAAL